MLEPRSYYHPYGETGKQKQSKWCVKLVLSGEFISRGTSGHPSRKSAQQWLDYHVKAINEGKIYQGYTIQESEVYFAGRSKK